MARRRARHNPSAGLIMGAAALGVLVVGGIAYAATRKPTAAPTSLPPALPTTPTQPATGAAFITLIPNQPNAASQGTKLGDLISIELPAGANWRSGGMNPTSGNQPITWGYIGPGTVNLAWVDSTGAQQTTAMPFYTVQ
jgi:hypothetical protein